MRLIRDACLTIDNVVDVEMQLNSFGRIVENELTKTANLRINIALDRFAIMPNHVHAIIFINCRGVLQYAPTIQNKFRSPSQTISAIVRGFKSAVTKRINELRITYGAAVWQRNYHEHVIPNEHDLNELREYIMNNPLKWERGKEKPKNWKSKF